MLASVQPRQNSLEARTTPTKTPEFVNFPLRRVKKPEESKKPTEKNDADIPASPYQLPLKHVTRSSMNVCWYLCIIQGSQLSWNSWNFKSVPKLSWNLKLSLNFTHLARMSWKWLLMCNNMLQFAVLLTLSASCNRSNCLHLTTTSHC